MPVLLPLFFSAVATLAAASSTARLCAPVPDTTSGLSAATAGECAAARASGCVDLIGLSPAFDTATKRDAGAGLGLEGVRTLATQAGLPCVAIGGIDETRAARLRGAGVIGICVVSAICSAHDPQAGARQLLAAFAGTAA